MTATILKKPPAQTKPVTLEDLLYRDAGIIGARAEAALSEMQNLQAEQPDERLERAIEHIEMIAALSRR